MRARAQFRSVVLAALLAAVPLAGSASAANTIAIDVATGKVLSQSNATQRWYPASTTKLMTAYLVFDAIKARKLSLEQTIPVSVRAWSERKGGGSLMFIDTTMKPTVDELLKGMIVQSGNDASVALAEAVGGSLDNFVTMMNRQAQAWGLKNTSFRNVTGLTEASHHSTARDIAVIAGKVITDHPNFYSYYSLKQFTFNNIKQDNRNMLLGRDASVDGMKTGYTEAAGYCLVASAQRDMPNGKRRLLSVVMGTASREARASESQKLLNWGWQAWDAVRLFDAGKPVATVPVWKGKSAEARLGAPGGAVFVTVPKGTGAQIKTLIQRSDPLVAPLAAGQKVGTIQVTTATGTPVASLPLVVQEPVELAGLLGRAWDSLRLWIK